MYMYVVSNYYISICIYICINKIKNIYIIRIFLYCICISFGNFISICIYVDDNKNVRIRLKNILFEYIYSDVFRVLFLKLKLK